MAPIRYIAIPFAGAKKHQSSGMVITLHQINPHPFAQSRRAHTHTHVLLPGQPKRDQPINKRKSSRFAYISEGRVGEKKTNYEDVRCVCVCGSYAYLGAWGDSALERERARP